jgi:hypothetical protein
MIFEALFLGYAFYLCYIYEMDTQNIQSLTNILNSTNSYLKIIGDNLDKLTSNHWIMLGVFANFLVVLGAIYAANRNSINGYFCKPKIQISKTVSSVTQGQNALLVSRLIVNNINKPIAKNVSFCVKRLWHFKNMKWVAAPNFISFPLAWTHTDVDSRDLFFKRPYLLDLCVVQNINTVPRIQGSQGAQGSQGNHGLYLSALHGGLKSHGLDDLEKGRNRIQLTLYCENHPTKHYCVEIEWAGTFCHPKIEVSEL